MTRLRTLVAALCAAAGLGLVACGGDGESTSEGPAAAVPADAPLYFESVASIDDAEGLTSALETLGVEDPAGTIGEQLDAELQEDGETISYTEDVEPLIGERGGFFVESFGAAGDLADATSDCVPPDGEAVGVSDDGCALPAQDATETVASEGDGALVVETSDEDGARELIDQLIVESEDPVQDATHNGVEYKLNPEDGDAVAVFDGFVVVGTEPSVQAAIDASQGDSLADSQELQSELDDLESDPVFTAYAEPVAILDQLEAAGEVESAERGVFEQAAGGLADVPAVFTVGADSDQLTFDASTGVAESAQAPAEESPLLRELPGDSWAATAVPDLGASVQQALDQFTSTIGTAAPDIEKELRRETGLDLTDLTGAIGDVGFFVRGTNPLDVGGGAVIEDLDPAATADAIAVLRRLAQREAGPGERITDPGVEGEGFTVTSPDMTQPINVVQRDDRLVIAYGDEATEDAFAPGETLGDSVTFTAATEALGDYGVSLILQIAPALDLAEAGGASEDTDYAQARPYLQHLDYLITGGRVDDDRSRVRAVIGLTE
jgi:Protein of unknown function (DUF3352)